MVDNTLYRKIVGSLMYLTATRPDIMYVVSLISRYMESTIEIHLLAAKRILLYLQGTKDFGCFTKRARNRVCLILLILIMQVIKTVGRAFQEANFFYFIDYWSGICCCYILYLSRCLVEKNHWRTTVQTKKIVIFCDNNSAVKLTKNPVLHERSKHIDVKFYFCYEISTMKEQNRVEILLKWRSTGG